MRSSSAALAVAIVLVACGDESKEGPAADQPNATQVAPVDEPDPNWPPPDPGPDPLANIVQPNFRIDMLDGSRYVVDRDLVLQVLVDGLGGRLHARKVSTGYEIQGVAKTSVARRLGVIDGDVVVSVNGVPLTGPEPLRRVFALTRTAGQIELNIQRRGENVERSYMLYESVKADMPPDFQDPSSLEPSDELRAFEGLMSAARSGIRQVGDTEWTVDRRLLTQLQSNPIVFQRTPVLIEEYGKVGMFVPRGPSIYLELGLTRYDRVKSFDSREIREPESLASALMYIYEGDQFTIALSRLGEPVTQTYRLVSTTFDESRWYEAYQKWMDERRRLDPYGYDDPYGYGGSYGTYGATGSDPYGYGSGSGGLGTGGYGTGYGTGSGGYGTGYGGGTATSGGYGSGGTIGGYGYGSGTGNTYATWADVEAVLPNTGVPACDDPLAAYARCMWDTMPADSRDAVFDAFSQMGDAWKDAANTTSGRDALEESCVAAGDAWKDAAVAMGCTWPL